MVWKPRLTVAAIIEQGQRFLMVEEAVEGRLTLNQPAGHVEDRESILQAVVRETLEETACDFIPESIVGLYRWVHPNGDTYLRAAFCGRVARQHEGRALDPDIQATRWLGLDELRLAQDEGQMRSPLVLRCIEDYLAGKRYPLALLQDVE